MNVDGAVFKERKEYGVGVIIRDVNGLVVAAMCKEFQAPLCLSEVEAKAFEFGPQSCPSRFVTSINFGDVYNLWGSKFV